MNKFYSNLIDISSLTIELDSLDLSEKEKLHLAQLIDSSLHNTILDAVLSELSLQDKEKFLKLLSENNGEEIWKLLNSSVDSIEDKIKKAAEDLKTEMHKDLKKARIIKKKNQEKK